MAFQLKLGTENGKKTRSSAKSVQRILFGFQIIILSIFLAGCRNDYVSLDDIQLPTVEIAQPQVEVTTSPETLASESIATAAPLGAGVGGGIEPEEIPPTDFPVETTTPYVDLTLDVEPTFTPVMDITDEPEPILPETQPTNTSIPPLLYYTQAGDTLPAIVVRFNVKTDDIVSADPLTKTGFLDPNHLLMIPQSLANTANNLKLIPDSEIVFSPSALDFDIDGFVNDAGGYLSEYREYLNSSGWLDGVGVIRKVAIENSINPRFLLALLQYKSNWVYGQPANERSKTYPLGHVEQFRKGLYSQLTWSVSQVSLSYYGWREGIMTDIPFMDGIKLRAAPEINAGTYGVQYLFAQMYDFSEWEATLYGQDNFLQVFEQMFGDPWLRAVAVEPLFPATLKQPDFILPIEPDEEWSYTGGPHSAWGLQGARAALDFAPGGAGGCSTSNEWVLAAASGVVVRSGGGVVVLDLDGDGIEQTGWNLFYMHIATLDRPEVGQWLNQGDRLGHPSCEGGVSTGTHVHIARKYNGEWILAGGPLPFNMDGWIAHAAAQTYKGNLTRDGKTVNACSCATADTYIFRDKLDPD
jgi:murein DD-endopeptidase MepM/ murein hydrolase activator NlpD